MQKQLRRRVADRKFGGVCAGLGQYFAIDPTWIRLGFILLALTDGIGVLLYFLLWILVPAEGREEADPSETIQQGAQEMAQQARHLTEGLRKFSGRTGDATRFIGVGRIIPGVFLTLRSLELLWLQWFSFGTLWPLILIALGVVMIFPFSTGRDGGVHRIDYVVASR